MGVMDTDIMASYECGSYHDNYAMFEQARVHFAAGRRADGLAVCDRLLAHILIHKDEKSERWLLPRIHEELRSMKVVSDRSVRR